ncbi:MAG: hypothetical protein KJ922_01595, partial [Nanoarchaeota archaeon]|nr:hypothetical protein [Nanoarchaeota archaeon]
LDDNPTESDGVTLSEGEDPIPYWFYLRAPNICTDCEMMSLAPTPEHIQDQVSTYVERNLPSCLNGFRVFKEQGFDIDYNNISATTDIATDDISVSIQIPMDITKDGSTTRIEKVNTNIDLSFSNIYLLATSIAFEEMINQTLEDLFLYLLSDYSLVPNPNGIPPISWIDKKTTTVTWDIQQVEDRLKQYVIGTNFNLIQIDKTRGAQRINADNPFEQGIYEAMYLKILTKELPNQEVTFFYNPEWPIYFDISPKPLRPTTINTDFPFNIAPSTQTNYYEFYYDISFPVVVMITDNRSLRRHGEKGYTFMFALEVNIRDNKNMLLWNQGQGTIGTWNNAVINATYGGLLQQPVQCEEGRTDYQCPNTPLNIFHDANTCDINCTADCIKNTREWTCPLDNKRYTSTQTCAENCKQEVSEVRNPQEIETLFCNEEQRISGDINIRVKDDMTNQLLSDAKLSYGCGTYRQCTIGTTSAGTYKGKFPICIGDGYITVEKQGYVTKTFEHISMEYEVEQALEFSLEPYKEIQVEVYHIPISNLYRVKTLLENATRSGYHIAGNTEYENNTIVNKTRTKLYLAFNNLTKILNPAQATRDKVVPWARETMLLLNTLSQEVNQYHVMLIGNYTSKIAKEMDDIQFVDDIDSEANINYYKSTAKPQKSTFQAMVTLSPKGTPPPLTTASIMGQTTAPIHLAPGNQTIRITVIENNGTEIDVGGEMQALEAYQIAGATLDNNTGEITVTRDDMSASKIRFYAFQVEPPITGDDMGQLSLIDQYSKTFRKYIEPEFIQ